MKKVLFLSALLLSAVRTFALPSYDPFANATGSGGSSYATSALLSGQTNAAGEVWYACGTTSTAASVVMTNNNLTAPGSLPASSGNAIVLKNVVGPGARLNIGNYLAANNATLFYSGLLQVSDITALLTAGGAFNMGFSATTGSSTPQGTQPADIHGILYMTKNGTSFQLGVGKFTAGTTATRIYDSGLHSVGETVFVVVEYEIVGGPSTGTNDVARLWINPSSSTFGASTPPTATVTAGGDGVAASEADVASLNSFVLLNRNTGTPNTMAFDELRIGTTWAYVTGGPEISTQPTNTQTKAIGATANISVAAKTSGSALTYQWKRNGTALTDGVQGSSSTVSGSTTAALTIAGIARDDGATYTCVVSNTLGAATSAGSILVTDPSITTQPIASQSAAQGDTIGISIVATGSALTYQWQKGGVNLANGVSASGSTISGSTSAALTLAIVAGGDSDSYTCVVGGPGGSITSDNSILSVVDPAISGAGEPVNVSTNFGSTATFTVSPSGTSPFTYQWLRNGISLANGASPSGLGAISGAQQAALSISSVAFADGGNYSVIVSNNLGSSVTSSSATLVVRDPIIVTQPANTTVTIPNAATFSVNAQGSGTLNYSWKKGNSVLSNTGNINGSGSAILTLSPTTSGDAGNYSVVISGADGFSYTSTTNTLTVLTPVTIVSAPISRVQRAGENTAFVVLATGTGPFSYQWAKTSGPISGATANSLVLTNIQTADADTYTVTVIGAAGPTTSSATLNVQSGLIHLSPSRLVVSRVGDGAQLLNNTATACGNTLYFDQFDTNGTYFASTMIPDNLTNSAQALIVNGQDTGSGAVGLGESLIGVSPDNRFLGFGGYNVSRPYTGASTINAASASAVPRACGILNGLGYYQMTVRSTIASSGGTLRSVMPDSTGTNFWTAAGDGLKFLNNASNLVVDTVAASHNLRAVQGFTNTVSHTYDLYTSAAGSGISGIYKATGTPTSNPTPASAQTALLMTDSSINLINEFSVSPDGTIAYVAEGLINANSGSLVRFTNNGGTWVANYSFAVPSRGLLVDWSGYADGQGAVIYATTAETNRNRIVKLIDTGVSSATNVIAVAATNTLFRSLRFGPVADAVAIVGSPVDSTIATGGRTVLTVSATGSAPFTYQWQKDGTNLVDDGSSIIGATTAALTLSNITASAGGNYSAIVSNDVPSGATSSPAALTVIDPVVITGPETDKSLNAGDALNLNATASGGGIVTYQWQKGGINLANGATGSGSTVSGAATLNLTVNNVDYSDAGTYSLIVANQINSATNNVVVAVQDPAIVASPQSASVECGANAGLSVSVTASGSVSYQWYKDGNTYGLNSSALSFSPAHTADSGSYYVVVTGAVGAATSSTAVFSVVDTLAPVITLAGSSSVTIDKGSTYADLGATANDTCAGDLTGSISVNNPVSTASAGTYTVTYNVSDVSGNAATAVYRTVAVVDAGFNITSQPASLTNVVTTTAIFSMGLDNPSGLVYQWQKDGADIGGLHLSYSGVGSSSLTINGVATNDAGGFTCIVTDGSTTRTSVVATLTVLDPGFTVQPQDVTANKSSNATFTAVAAGSSLIKYQWYSISNAHIAKLTGKTTTNLTVAAGSPLVGYYATATDAHTNVITSRTASVNVLILPTFSASPANHNGATPTAPALIAGNDVTFTVKVATNATLPLHYQWNFNGTPIDAANGSALALTDLKLGDAGTYTCTVTNAAGLATSSSSSGRLVVKADTSKPSISITSPKNGARLTNTDLYITGGMTSTLPNVVLSGAASDNGRIQMIKVQRLQPVLETFALTQYVATAGKIYWTNVIALLDGTNKFEATVTDEAGNAMASNVVTVFYVNNTTMLTVNNTGNVDAGTNKPVAIEGISPHFSFKYGTPTNGASLEIGRNYKITAVPAKNNIFTNWTDASGLVLTTNITVLFNMKSNYVLNANFLTNQIVENHVNGKYNGLVENGSGDLAQIGSILNLTVGTNRTFSGTLNLQSKSHTIAGSFDLHGDASLVVDRSKLTPSARPNLNVSLHLDWVNGTHQITGTVAVAESFTSTVLLDQAIYGATNAYPGTARYTMVIPATDATGLTSPMGAGIAGITNTGLGVASIVGHLADGTSISQGLPVSKDNVTPVSIRLNASFGLLQGWLTFTNAGVTGTLTWIKASTNNPVTYTNGFTSVTEVVGHVYNKPVSPATVFGSYTNLHLVVDDNEGFSKDASLNQLSWNVQLKGNNFVLVPAGSATNKFSAAAVGKTHVSTGDGTFSLSYKTSVSGLTKTMVGIVDQVTGTGTGYVIGTTNVGTFHLTGGVPAD